MVYFFNINTCQINLQDGEKNKGRRWTRMALWRWSWYLCFVEITCLCFWVCKLCELWLSVEWCSRNIIHSGSHYTVFEEKTDSIYYEVNFYTKLISNACHIMSCSWNYVSNITAAKVSEMKTHVGKRIPIRREKFIRLDRKKWKKSIQR